MVAGIGRPDREIAFAWSFVAGGPIEDLVDEGLLHPGCSGIFRIKADDGPSRDLRLHRHQADAIRAAAITPARRASKTRPASSPSPLTAPPRTSRPGGARSTMSGS